MKKKLSCLLLAFASVPSFAQVEFNRDLIDVYSVNNDGTAVGTIDQRSPFFIWNPDNELFQEIGGVSAGQGVGGMARFTEDGKTIAAVNRDSVAVSDKWTLATLEKSFIITDLYSTPGIGCLAIGRTQKNDSTIILRSATDGVTWNIVDYPNMIPFDCPKGGLVSVCMFEEGDLPGFYFAGGHNGVAYYGNVRGATATYLDPRPTGSSDQVTTYWAVDFKQEAPHAGVYGAELADGSGVIYQSPDGGESFQTSTGVQGIPAHITHTEDAFFLVTKNGFIQKSTDEGQTWTTVFEAENGKEFFDLLFLDNQIGLATSTDCLYRTEDGGTVWTKIEVGAGISPWADSDHNGWFSIDGDESMLLVSSTGGMLYQSADKGLTWKKYETEGLQDTNLYAVAVCKDYMLAGGNNGVLALKRFHDSQMAHTASLYDMASGNWTPLGNLGYIADEIASNAYDISGDGSTVAGSITIKEGNNMLLHAAVWDHDKAIWLGSKFAGKSTRVNGVSYDGSVAVGWQDKWGPWMATIWYRDEQGKYTAPEFIFVEEGMTDADVNMEDAIDMVTKIPQEAICVSPDGKWVGGYGNQAPLDCPWIWSKETGYRRIGEAGQSGGVTDMNNDATLLVGYSPMGGAGWIWTEELGRMNINTFVTDILGGNLEDVYLCSVHDISPNGRYLAGWGIDSNYRNVAFRIDLGNWITSIEEETGICEVAVYPNPVSEELHVDLVHDGHSVVRLFDLNGKLALETECYQMSNIIRVDGIAKGHYVLEVTTEGLKNSFKVEIR